MTVSDKFYVTVYIGSGNLTEKGKVILKEVGITPGDIDDRY